MTEIELLKEEALWRRQTVVERTGVSYQSIYRMEQMGAFPARRVLGKNTVAWLASEVIQWMHDRPTAAAQPLGIYDKQLKGARHRPGVRRESASEKPAKT